MAPIESKTPDLLEDKRAPHSTQKYDNYTPSEEEEFMNPQMRKYFLGKVESMIEELERDVQYYLDNKLKEKAAASDYMDKVSINAEQALSLSRYNFQCDLLCKARLALHRIETNTYGYCEVTGLPISVKRLMANPIAEASLDQ